MSPRFEHCLTAIVYIPLCKKKKSFKKVLLPKNKRGKKIHPLKITIKKKKKTEKERKAGTYFSNYRLILVTVSGLP